MKLILAIIITLIPAALTGHPGHGMHPSDSPMHQVEFPHAASLLIAMFFVVLLVYLFKKKHHA